MISRRTLLTGTSALLGASLVPLHRARAQAQQKLLTIGKRNIEVKGRAASVYGITGPDGKPGLRLLLGEHFNVRLVNATETDTLIHWHGLTPPHLQDGVPGVSQPALKPGEGFDYDFVNTRSGTHWMHSHQGLQEQQMLAAPLIVQETKEPVFDEADHVVMVHDFTFRDPSEILAELQQGGGGHAGHKNMGGMNMGGMDHSRMGHGANGMKMGGMLNDVAFDAYLANDRTLDDPEIVTVEKGGTIRLRIINAAAASNMWIDLGEAQGELIAVDGNAIYPVEASLFPLAIAQRADIRVKMPSEGGVIPVLFRPEGVAARTGVVLASPGAAVATIAEEGDMTPAVDLSQELVYRSVARIRQEPVTHTEMLMLTGGDEGYRWGFNGKASMHGTLFSVREGERVAVMMHNMTGMAHPMHLHGHYFKVVAVGNQVFDGALRDTVLVPPMQTVTIAFDADNPGTWAFHCHHAYHMNSGMMGTISYTSAA